MFLQLLYHWHHQQLLNGLSVSIFVIVYYFIGTCSGTHIDYTCSNVSTYQNYLTSICIYITLGSSVPSAFLLWVMRELPPSRVLPQKEKDSLTIAFIPETTVTAQHPQRWTIATTSSQNQVLSFCLPYYYYQLETGTKSTILSW